MSGAFDLLDRPLVFVPVKWPGVAADRNGDAERVEHCVTVQIEILDRDEFSKWIVESNKDFTPAQAEARATHELAMFRQVAKGWRGVVSNKRPVQFDDEHIAKLLVYPGFVEAFGKAYMQTWAAEVAIREGNSEGSLGNGPAGEPIGATSKAGTSLPH